jgi:hypothetical protein
MNTLQVEEAMRTGALVPDSAAALLEHAQAQGQKDMAQQKKDAQALKRLDDAAAFAASVAKLESTKQIPLEERVSSPGPAGSTRSRTAIAARAVSPAAPGSVMPSVSVMDPVDQSRSLPSSQSRAGLASPRVATPAPATAPAADAGLGSDSGGASIRQNQNNVRVQMLVPRAKMGLLIGTQGKNIRELLQEAKTLGANLHVPSMTSPDDKATESGGDKPVMKKNGLVIITGPRESVAKLKDKVAAIISGQTSPESRDPLAYIEPYMQGSQSSGSTAAVPKEAQRLLQLIQKLSLNVEPGDQLPENDSLYTEIAPGDAVDLAASTSVNQSGLAWFPYPANNAREKNAQEMQAPAAPATAAAPHNPTAPVTDEMGHLQQGHVQHVTKGAFGSSPSKAGANTAPLSPPDISALRFKLDHVTQGLDTVTRALGQLNLLPENLEPYPSEIAESLVLKKGSTIDDRSSSAPLVIYSRRCLQHQVEAGVQEHPGRLEVIFGANGVLMQVCQEKSRNKVRTFFRCLCPLSFRT